MTHKEIVEKLSKWLRRHKENIKIPNCSLVLSEFVTANYCGETPDILGFNYWTSVMIEVKTSRSDFKADMKKRFKKFSKGSGEFKFYACPYGMLDPDEMPDMYGLIYIDVDENITLVKPALRQKNADLRVERSMLLSYIRRLKNVKP